MKPHDLIKTCRLLLASGRRPTQVTLRRTTSTAYYAVFHCLAHTCADLMIGTAGADRSIEAWRQVYRSLEHGVANNQCKNKQVMPRFPQDIQDFANAFITLQEKRNVADYDPLARFVKSEVAEDVDNAESIINIFNRVPIRDRRAFCAWVLLRNRG